MFRKLLLIILFLIFASAAHTTPIEKALANELLRMYGLDTSAYVIKMDISRLKTTDVEPGELSLRAITQKEPLGIFTVAATIQRNGATIESAQVRLRISRFADVLVAADKIGMHERLSQQSVAIRRTDITTMFEKPLTSIDEIAGRRAARLIRQGTVLTAACVELPPDVESGRSVTIVFTDGLCRVSAAGTVLQPGAAGDYIKVRNNSSGKILMARVVDQNAVAVDPVEGNP